MTIIGSASIQIRADDKYFEPDVKRAVAKIKNLSIQLRVDADTSAASKKIRDLRYRLTQKDAEIKIRANDAKFEDDVRKAVNKIRNVQIDLKADVDVAKASKKIRDLRYRITSNVAVLKIDADTTRAEEKMRKFLEKFTENKKLEFTAVAHTGEANTALEDLRQRYAANRVPFTAEANTTAANAALAFTARRRRAQIFAHVDPKAMAAVKGMFNTLTGTLPFDKVKNVLFGIMSNFEGIVTKGTIAVAVVNALSASVITLGANIFSIGGDITQVIGMSAMLPAAFIAMGAVIASNKMAWKGFGEALSSDAEKAAEAIAKLEPAAQSAALAMRGTGAEIKKATQVSFWSNMNGVVEYAVDRLLPELVSGFGAVGSAMGQLQNTGITALADTFGGGVLEGILGNVAGMLSNASTGVAKFISAFGTLAVVGSTYLPEFGQSVTDAATRFDNFIKKADEAGRINQWIETASRRLQELGSISKSTISIMSGITDIARISGAPGLTEMAGGLSRIAGIVNSEPFVSRMLTIFVGAREGTDRLGEGLSTLADLFGRSADSVSAFLSLAGEIAGLTFSNITAMFEGTGLGSGLYAALSGLREALVILEPGFRNLGVAVGEIGTIAGALLISMAPGLNMLADTIAQVTLALGDGFIAAMVPLNEFIQSILPIASALVVGLATAVGSLLEVFGNLPSVVQIAIAVFTAFILLKGRFDAFFLSIQVGALKAWTSMTTSATTNTARVQALLAAQATAAESASARQIRAAQTAAATLTALSARTAAAQAASAAGAAAAQGASAAAGAAAQTTAATTAAAGVGNASRSMADHGARIAGAWRGVGSTFQNAGGGLHGLAGGAAAAGSAIGVSASSGLQMAGKGLLTMLGGPWGAGLAVAGVALSLFAAKNAEAKAQVADMTATLDKQTGAFTAATKGKMAEGILDLDQGKVEKFSHWLNGASEDATTILDRIGVSVDDVSKRLMDAKGAQEYMDAWKEITTTLTNGGNVSEELANKIDSTAVILNNMDSNELSKVGADIRTTGEAALKAAADVQALADATGTNTIQAQRLSDNYATLESTTSSVSAKLSALKSNLDILNGGKQTQLETEKSYQQGLRDTSAALTEISQREGVRMSDLVSSSGAFNMASQASSDLHTELSAAADGILELGIAAYDTARQNGATLEEAQVTAMQSMAGPIQSFRDSLTALGFGEEQINGIVESMNLVPDKIETALLANGDQALMEAARTELGMKAFANGEYEAVLAAMPDSAKAAIADAYGVAEEYADGDYEAVLTAMDKTPGGREAALASLLTVSNGEYNAVLGADNLVPEKVEAANRAAQGLVKEKNIDILAKDLATPILENLNSYDVDGKKVDLTANDQVSAILSQVNSSSMVDKQNQLTTEDLVSDIIENVNATQMDGKMTDLQARDLASAVMDEVNAKTMDGKVSTLTANDLVSTVIANIGTLRFDPKNVDIIATDTATSVLANVNAYDVMDRNIDLTATDLISDVLNQVNASPLVDKDSQLTTQDLVTQVVNDVNAKQLNGKLNQLQTQDLVSDVLAYVNAKKLGNKGSSLTTRDLVSAVIDGINNKHLADKSNRIITYHSTIYSEQRAGVSPGVGGPGGPTMADGGIMRGRVQAFANGGILNGAKGAAVKAFAGGGVENHTAQIARGAWPVRIWAEPETGGEAYIPLSKSKRKRSLDILKIVMGEFGLGHLTKQFANGGIMPATQTPSVVSNRYSVPSGNSGFASALQSNTTPIVVQVNPSASLDEEQVGKAAASQLYWQIMSTQK